MVKKFFCVLLLAAACLAGAASRRVSEQAVQTMAVSPVSYTIVIDAGHGGEDGGAVSITGTPESQINLAIACKLEDILALYGVPSLMLRREDVSLHDQEAETLREKKVSDLHNRVSAIEEAETPVVLSIHQNSYPDGRYHGAQVFYAPTEGSEALAQHTRNIFGQSLDPGNTREIKKIPDTVYLMNHVSCPAILVECGFLTNPEEEALLRQAGYQRKLAGCLASAVLTMPTI